MKEVGRARGYRPERDSEGVMRGGRSRYGGAERGGEGCEEVGLSGPVKDKA